MTWLPAIERRGRHVMLEPLVRDHVDALCAAVRDGEAWRLWVADVPSPQQMRRYVETALAASDQRAFVVRERSGDIVGTTRFYGVDAVNRRALIGFTWYAARVRGTAVNSESKYLLLSTLFDENDAIAAAFRTHSLNIASRRAIEALGAKQDGLLRNHRIRADGTLRDTAVYSIIAAEWPAVRANLRSRLAAYA
ncbi:GCN5-like N-acetyltransferase [Salinisphaera sp. S4-8]|uniref:GNAT family N-acetyltransferase n=1 Tax=Salinisphaera sp. S4-8 TaxID=633357 RepID=UPI003340ED58